MILNVNRLKYVWVWNETKYHNLFLFLQSEIELPEDEIDIKDQPTIGNLNMCLLEGLDQVFSQLFVAPCNFTSAVKRNGNHTIWLL